MALYSGPSDPIIGNQLRRPAEQIRRLLALAESQNETAWNVGLSCGGTIRVFVEKVGSS